MIMKSKLFTLLCTSCLVQLVSAQNFTQWWKQVDAAAEKDQPKTAIQSLRLIRKEAIRSGNAPQLLRALFTEQVMQEEIAPDSGAVMRQLIETELAKEKRPVERALWLNALGRLYTEKARNAWRRNDTADVRKAHDLLLESVQQTALLGETQTQRYATLFDLGRDSKPVYGDDLLSVLTEALVNAYEDNYFRPIKKEELREVLQRNLDFYRQQGRRRAALHTEWKLADLLEGEKRLEFLRKVSNFYEELPENGETIARICALLRDKQLDEAVQLAKAGEQRYGKAAVELHNFLADVEQPNIQVDWSSPELKTEGNAFYPGATYRALIRWKNMKSVKINFIRLKGVDASLNALRTYGFNPDNYIGKESRARLLSKVPHETALTLHKELPTLPAHHTTKDSIEFKMPAAGVYVAELWANDWLMGCELVLISRGTLFELKTQTEKGKKTYVDVITGQPITDPQEIATVPDERRKYDFGFRNEGNYTPNAEKGCQIYTDRPMYRPGQRMEFATLLYSRNGDTYNVVPNKEVKVKLQDSRHEDLDTLTVKTDAFGIASGQFTLPRYCRTGEFSLVVNAPGHEAKNSQFRVEEYQRPKFEVKFDTLPSPLQSVGEVKVRGRVLTMNGLPVRNTRIAWNWNLDKVWYWESDADDDDTRLDGKGETTTDDEGRFEFAVNMKADVKTYYWLSVKATATAPDGETHDANQTAYVNNDREQPTQEKPMIATTTAPNGDKATITFGEKATVIYNLVSAKGDIVEHRVLNVKAGTQLPVAWKAEWGDAVTAFVSYMKKGEEHTDDVTVKRPEPDKRLLLKWHTFRSQLTPGQEETWMLSVTTPDGRPAQANVMARLYDASLDALLRNKFHNQSDEKDRSPWRFYYNFVRQLPITYYQRQQWYDPSLNGSLPGRATYEVPSPIFTVWTESMFDYRSNDRMRVGGVTPLSMLSAESAAPQMVRKMVISSEDRVMPARAMRKSNLFETGTPQVRTNFSETAFFRPTLRTNESGMTTLHFTLPESLTQWKFNAFAHDRELNSGTLDETIIARKQLTAEVAVPRCLREGDEMEWPITVRNISGKPTAGNYVFTVEDATDKRVLNTFNGKFSLNDGHVFTQRFAMRVPDGCQSLLVRVTARNNEFSDGEERMIPVLSRQIEVTRAVPFTIRPGESLSEKEAEARRRLTAMLEKGVQPIFKTDTCRDARKEVAKVVPSWMQVVDGSAYEQAVAFYGIQLASKLREYLQLSDYEIQAYRASAADRLREMQNGDGSWPWFRGLSGSNYITAQIAVLLARAQTMTGAPYEGQMCRRAMSYLDGELQKAVEEMKRDKVVANELPEWIYNYLYAAHLLRRKATPSVQYVLKKFAQDNKHLTMYGKSAQAVVLSGTAYDETARNALQSVVEHTVTSPEMGRYFDTERALGGWASYRIPTQTFAIEALQRLAAQMPTIDGTPNAQLVDELKLWLLQSKRTQVWNTSRATTDAAYALLSQPASGNQGLTWGAVSASYKVDAAKVQAAGNGFRIERRFEVQRDGKWAKVDGEVRVGERVRWVYDVTADRDFDQVSLQSTRPAGLEPRDPLSGVVWTNGVVCYRMVHDADNEYFIEHLSKGKHTFTDECVAVRAGRFDGGIARVQSVFAPEFSATSTPMKLIVR